MAEESDTEFVDPFDTGRDGESDSGEGEGAVEPPWDKRKGPKPYQEVVQELESLPVEPDEEMPPEPTFLIVRNAYGPGAHSVKFANGTPVGVWVREQEMTPEEVFAQLTAMGLDADLVDFFTRNREKGIAADEALAADPVVAAFQTEEDRRFAEKKETQAAFIAAYRKKQKEKA